MKKFCLLLLPLFLASCRGTVAGSSPAPSESQSSSESETPPSESSPTSASSSPTTSSEESPSVEAKADLSLTREDIPSTSQNSYLIDEDIEVDGIGFHLNYVQQGTGENAGTIQMHKADGEIYNTDPLGHNRVIITLLDKRNQWNPVIARPIVYAGMEMNPNEYSEVPNGDTGDNEEYVWIYDFDAVYPYFRIENSDPEIERAAYAYSIAFTNVG